MGLTVGIDIGGTKIAAGVVGRDAAPALVARTLLEGIASAGRDAPS